MICKIQIILCFFLFPLSLIHGNTWEGIVFPEREIYVSARDSGLVSKVKVFKGDAVGENAVLGHLYDEEQVLEKKRLEKILEIRQYELSSIEKLYKKKVVSEDQAVKARVECDIAGIEFKQSIQQLERRRIVAPVNAIVMEVHVEAGEWVDPGKVVFELAQIDQLYVCLLLPAVESMMRRIGEDVEVEFVDGRASVMGKLARMDPRVDAKSGLRRVEILIENTEHKIIPGIQARVTFKDQ